MKNIDKIKNAKTTDEMIIALEQLLYIFATSKKISDNNDLKQWLESESEE